MCRHFTAITLMAMPADVYKYGAFQWLGCISMFLLVILSVYIYFPVFFNLQLTSAYEYLERRFDKKTKLLASSLYLLCEFIYLAVVAYTPSLALSVCKFQFFCISVLTNLVSSHWNSRAFNIFCNMCYLCLLHCNRRTKNGSLDGLFSIWCNYSITAHRFYCWYYFKWRFRINMGTSFKRRQT